MASTKLNMAKESYKSGKPVILHAKVNLLKKEICESKKTTLFICFDFR